MRDCSKSHRVREQDGRVGNNISVWAEGATSERTEEDPLITLTGDSMATDRTTHTHPREPRK